MRRSDSKIQFFSSEFRFRFVVVVVAAAVAVAVSLSDDVKVVVDHFNITMSTSRRRPKYFRTVIGGGRAELLLQNKKEQIQYAKVSSATASAHWDQRKLYSEIESQTKKCKSPEKP